MSRVSIGYQGPLAESTVPAATADGSELPSVWYDVYGRQVIYGSNLAIGSQDVSEVAPALSQFMGPLVFAQLTAAATYNAWTDVMDLNTVSWSIEINAIDTSVTIIFEGSPNAGTDIYTIATVTYLANDVYVEDYSGRKFPWVRAGISAEVGGANVTADIILFAGNI